MSKGKRLSRAESQQRTRELIIDAATKLFLERGYRATSLEEIGDEAGFTRGAVYSNFASKTAMGVAVIDALYDAELDIAFATVPALVDRGAEAWLDELGAWAQASFGDPRWARLEIEVAAFAGSEDGLRQATSDRNRRLRARAVAALQETAAAGEVKLSVDADLLALALISLGLGLGVQRASDPDIPGSAYADILRVLAPAILVP